MELIALAGNLGEVNSKLKPVCLDMPSPDMQSLVSADGAEEIII